MSSRRGRSNDFTLQLFTAMVIGISTVLFQALFLCSRKSSAFVSITSEISISGIGGARRGLLQQQQQRQQQQQCHSRGSTIIPVQAKRCLFVSSSSSTNLGAKSNTNSAGGNDIKERVEQEPCNVVFTHTNADFDSLAAAVALSMLWKHENPSLPTHVILPRGVNPVVQRFMAFHKQLLPVRGFKTIMPEDVHALGVVDAQSASRIGRGQAWLDSARSIHIYDHHDNNEDITPVKEKDSSGNTTGIVTEEKDGKVIEESDKKKENKTKAKQISLLDLATEIVIEKVGSTTTLLVERLKQAGISPASHEATLFALGIRFDTGGLVYEGTTVRDAAALLWCLENGASQVAIAEFGVAKVNDRQRAVLQTALRKTETETVNGLRVSSVLVTLEDQYVPGLAQICEEIMELTDSDVFLMGATHRSGKGKNSKNGGSKNKKNKKKNSKTAGVDNPATTKNSPSATAPTQWISLIGRATNRAVGVDLNAVMRQFGGGGHPKAAAGSLQCKPLEVDASINDDEKARKEKTLDELVVDANNGGLLACEAISTAISIIKTQIPEQLVASNCMASGSDVITVNEDYTVAEAREIFDKHGLKSAPVVDWYNRFRSSLKLNDLVKASRAGRSDDKLKGMMRPSVETVLPDTNLAELEDLLVNKGVGRIPVVDDDGIFVGMVTRTDVLRQQHLYGESDLDLSLENSKNKK